MGKGGIGMGPLGTKKVEISFVYYDVEGAEPPIFNIVNSFNTMIADLPIEIRHHIDNIEFKVEDLHDDNLDKFDSDS